MEACIWKPLGKKSTPLHKGMQIPLEKGTVLLLHSGKVIHLPKEPKGKPEDPWRIRQSVPEGYRFNLMDVMHAMQDYKDGLPHNSPAFYDKVVTIFFFSDKTYFLMDRGSYLHLREKCMKEWLWEPQQLKKGHQVKFLGTEFSGMHNALLVEGDLQAALRNLDKNKNIHWMHLIFFIPSKIKSQHVSGSKLSLVSSRKQNASVVWGVSDTSGKTALVSFSEWLQIIQRKPKSGLEHLCLAHHAHT